MSEEPGRRVALNEVIFRQVNEQIESLNHGFGTELSTMTVICECADGDCTERVEIAVSEYERVRADPLLYIIVPGHELTDVESIVDSGAGYDIVQKREGAAARLAKELDPRS